METDQFTPHAKWILLFLREPGVTRLGYEPVGGRTRLMKQLFLLRENAHVRPFYDDFQASHFGPSSAAVLSDLSNLVRRQMVGYDPTRYGGTYSLVSAGIQEAERLASEASEGDLEKIQNVKRRWNRVPLNQLLLYVYQEFPKYTEKSRIRDAVFQNPDERPRRPPNDPPEPTHREADESLPDDL